MEQIYFCTGLFLSNFWDNLQDDKVFAQKSPYFMELREQAFVDKFSSGA